MSSDFVEAVQKAEASVVRVQGDARSGTSGTVWSADGLVISSHAALGDPDEVQVAVAGGELRKAELVGREPALDLALLRVAGGNLAQPAFVADAGELRVGQWTVALGRPGEAIRASARIIGVLADGVRTPLGGKLERYVETDRGFPRGFSGGPLVDTQGRVIGVNTGALLRGADLTVPVAALGRAVSELLAHGKVRRGYLGVGVHPVRLPDALRAQAQRERALLVLSIEGGSAAERAGLLLGDAILDVGGRAVADPRELSAALTDTIGTAVTARIVRAGAITDLSITPGERP